MIRHIAIVGALSLPAVASGAGPAPAPAARAVPPEVERGFYSEFDFGTLAYLGEAGSNVQPGVMAGFAVGSDVGRYLKLEVRMLNATSDSTGNIYRVDGLDQSVIDANPCPPPVDPGQACTPAPDVQSSLVTGGAKFVYPLSDRLELHGLFAGGVLIANPTPEQVFAFDPAPQLNDPASVESGSTPIFGGGGGMSYYTHLRHFSVGADFAVWVAPGPGGLMVTLFPTIKYTF